MYSESVDYVDHGTGHAGVAPIHSSRLFLTRLLPQDSFEFINRHLAD
jgi:hypothetical protein